MGDFVVTGGEFPAMMVVDAVSRFIPGVLGDPTGAEDEFFTNGLLEYPHYTRPEEFRGWRVPDVLLSGHHAKILAWRTRAISVAYLSPTPRTVNNVAIKQKGSPISASIGRQEKRGKFPFEP